MRKPDINKLFEDSNKLTTYKLVRFEPQELIDLAALVYVSYEKLTLYVEKTYGITEDRLGDLALKLKKAIDGLEG